MADFDVHAEVELELHHKVKMKNKRPGFKKSVWEVISGSDYTYQTNTWNFKEVVIDRGNDLYWEKVIDPRTGQIIHECREPLSEHKGHGSAKPSASR